jgi:hypothetical protein
MATLRALFANLSAPMPWRTKVRLVLRNNVYKLTHRQGCCGRPGEPGC